jgi:hypothetical protein
MKIILYSFTLLSFILQFSVISSKADTIPYSSDYATVKAQLTTPQAIAAYMTAYFSYVSHYGYSPYAPDVFNARRNGDCKDYATFFGDILASHGYTVTKYAFRYDTTNGNGHVVCLFTDTNGLHYVASNKGNTQQIFGPVANLTEAGTVLLQNGILPQGSVADQWLGYPPGFTGQLQDSKGFLYNANYQTAMAQLLYFHHPAIYMTAFFTAETHKGAYAYTPEELNTRRAGDAKDFAVFNARKTYATIYSLRYNQKTNASHVISVTTYNSKYYFQSNQYFFGPLDSFEEIVPLLKANGHIPADSTVDNWQSYASTYMGPFPVATPEVKFSPATMFLLQE